MAKNNKRTEGKTITEQLVEQTGPILVRDNALEITGFADFDPSMVWHVKQLVQSVNSLARTRDGELYNFQSYHQKNLLNRIIEWAIYSTDAADKNVAWNAAKAREANVKFQNTENENDQALVAYYARRAEVSEQARDSFHYLAYELKELYQETFQSVWKPFEKKTNAAPKKMRNLDDADVARIAKVLGVTVEEYKMQAQRAQEQRNADASKEDVEGTHADDVTERRRAQRNR